ncbi:NH(3)-dependent NAD(+) synthetase [Jeotgalicoccus saudimassiliensis]|uniref:NH(3)-dependent NAD(+) synthetase n=1 Tax=Jeotgalicoccus saudimassiliensis TaxID=1461582 RepID=A0A078MC83_9STAP|nr:ammonia-dependent NAD(+) synthetase [Jeotgalicoccus saudimassiliensis]CEA03804.1 NH(3)-dependent NAD(+) synthetase [Jeotgalicoccus saudimassiliensis]
MDELQQQIIGKLHVKPEINPEEETRELIDFLKKYVGKYTFIKSFVLGISGGQDSTLLGKIAQLAVDELNEEGHDIKFYGVRLPYGEQRDEDDAKDAMDFISPSVETVINIKPAVDAGVQALSDSGYVLSDFVKGNEKARERMKVQYAIAAHTGGVVLGTDHAAEALTGFYTKYGDGAADLAPLTGLNKRQGREIMKYLGASAHLYEKIPTADLEDDKPLLSDEEALGVTYEHIDDFLEGKSVPDEAYDRIKTLYYQSQHKRDLPYNRYNLPV